MFKWSWVVQWIVIFGIISYVYLAYDLYRIGVQGILFGTYLCIGLILVTRIMWLHQDIIEIERNSKSDDLKKETVL